MSKVHVMIFLSFHIGLSVSMLLLVEVTRNCEFVLIFNLISGLNMIIACTVYFCLYVCLHSLSEANVDKV